MPHWESVFGHHYEIPGFVRFLVQKKILEDASWGNDTAPSFGVWDQTSDRRVVLWVDHPIRSKRENMSDRFHVQHDEEIVFSSDDLELALERLFKELGDFHAGKAPEGPKEWRPGGQSTRKDVLLEWQAKLPELLEEYYENRRE